MSIFCLENRIFLKIAWKNWNFLKICLKKLKFLTNLPGKVEIFHEIAEKIKISRKFAWKNLNFVDPDPRPPRFQTRLTPLSVEAVLLLSSSKGFVEDKKARLQWRLEESCVIKCGRLDKLVEAMCSPSGDLDSTFVDTLLATYRSFASSKELIEAIIKRYLISKHSYHG